jgi:hypothetical protein
MVTMLRGHGTADGVVSLRNNKDMSDDHCKDYPCSSYKDCCEYE